jgi:hypothetical protein
MEKPENIDLNQAKYVINTTITKNQIFLATLLLFKVIVAKSHR